MSRKAVVGCALAALVLVGAYAAIPSWAADAALAEHGDRPFARLFFGSLQQLHEMVKDLNLTPDQKAQIGEILKSHKAEIVPAVQALYARHQALLAAVRTEPVNEAAIRAAAKDMADAIGDASVLRAKIRVEIRAVMTPEQNEKVDQTLDAIAASVGGAINSLGAK